MPKCVLAFAGSLEGLIALPWLKEHRDLDVVTLSVDVGGGTDLEVLGEQALSAGAVAARVEDLRDTFYSDFIAPALRALAHYETYFLAQALSRPLVARELVRVALEEGALVVAHGSSIKGNDQIRFEAAIRSLAPELEIISPQHEWDLRTVEQKLQYARAKHLTVSPPQEQPFRYDRNLWGQSVKGAAFDDASQPPCEEAFTLTTSPLAAPAEPEDVVLEFRAGLPVGLNGKRLEPVALIEQLTQTGGRHGIGRADLIEDRMVGFKSREVYEAPAATVLYAAKRALEQLTLGRDSLQVREGLGVAYGRCVYNGQWFSDLREALDSFYERLNRNVTGQVTMRLYKGQATALARQSEFSLYSAAAASPDVLDELDHQAARGFTRVWTRALAAEAQRKKP